MRSLQYKSSMSPGTSLSVVGWKKVFAGWVADSSVHGFSWVLHTKVPPS